jgi:hypothetical protein
MRLYIPFRVSHTFRIGGFSRVNDWVLATGADRAYACSRIDPDEPRSSFLQAVA